MRIGLFGHSNTVDGIVEQVRAAREHGFSSSWWPQVANHDALTALAVAGREVPDIALGTAVVPTYPRHPAVMAQQAMTVQAATGNRLTLGIGLSHQVVIEGSYGYSFEKPARHMREYLSVLMPLMRDRAISYEGETLKAAWQLDVGDAEAPSVLLAALAPRMLELAGRVADGTITWMTGPKTLGAHIAPSVRRSAERAGRPEPRIVCALPVVVTDEPDAVRQRAANAFQVYGFLPSYRAMLDREGAGGPADVAILGDEDAVRAEIENVFDQGATEFVAVPFADRERTIELLKSML